MPPERLVNGGTALTITLSLLCVQLFSPLTRAHAQSFTQSTAPVPPRASDADAANAMELMTGDNWSLTRSTVVSLHDPLLFKVYEWMLYTQDHSGLPFHRIANFIQSNPTWPNQKALQATAERNITDALPPQTIMSWFTKYKPQTGNGAIRMLIAARQTGNSASAYKILNDIWPNLDLDEEQTKEIMRSVGNNISANKKFERLNKLLYAEKNRDALIYAGLLGRPYQTLATARIALANNKIKSEKDFTTYIATLPTALRSDPGLLFEKLSWKRRNDKNEDALYILAHSPDISGEINAKQWWKERNIMIRRMIEKEDYKTAYKLAATHGQTDKVNRAEAEFLAGWLALRFLNKPQEALDHFTTLYNNVGMAISKSRAAYWAGRAAKTLGRTDDSRQWFAIAANYPHTYYGQHAAKELGMYPPANVSPPQLYATEADVAYIENSELLRTAIIANHAGLDSIHNQLISALISTLNTQGHYMAAAQKLNAAGDMPGAFRIARAASWKNYDLGDYTFPNLNASMRGIGGNHALYNAIIRQESQFDPEAESRSGALGLMQLMPATAQETARKMGQPYNKSWLTGRPDYNIALGSYYINQLLGRFDNAMPLAIAGYNAGPNRVAGWIEDFGDPRTGEIDWIDWVELIPIAETRNYVQRVSENYSVYANRNRNIRNNYTQKFQ